MPLFTKKEEGKEKKPLFGKPKAPPAPSVNVHDTLNEMNRRLRNIEERYTNLQGKTQVTEQNMISRHKRIFNEMKAINSEISEIKHEIGEIKEKVLVLVKEFRSTAKKEDVKVLERYINLWEPMKFITRDEVEEVVKDIIKNQ